MRRPWPCVPHQKLHEPLSALSESESERGFSSILFDKGPYYGSQLQFKESSEIRNTKLDLCG